MDESARTAGGEEAGLRCPVRAGFRRVLLGLLVLVGVVGFLGIVRPWMDGRRMEGVAATLTHRLTMGATLDEATSVVDAMGLGHSPLVNADTWEREGPGGAGRDPGHAAGAPGGSLSVMFVMIHHEVEPWRLVSRDIQVRVYFDSAHRLVRAETRDVFTGP